MSTAMITAQAVTAHAHALLTRAGLDDEKASAVAHTLVEGDLMGHDTHGTALLAPYLAELESGKMTKVGEPLITHTRPAAQVWDGQRLPGPWLTHRAVDAAANMARIYGTGTVTIRRSHHIAALAAYLTRATDQGLMLLIACSDPNTASVAPFGGIDPVFTPNPMAFGIPLPQNAATQAENALLVDVSSSITTNGMSNRLAREGKRMPGAWLLDDQGQPSDDPKWGVAGSGGTIQLLGGIDAGHKGFGLTLLVEAMTGGLAAHGRADAKEGWGATVFVQVLDPQAFGGLDAFTRQTGHIADASRASRPRVGGPPVRLPGERAMARKAAQLRDGMQLHPGILPSLAPWAEKYGVKPLG
jgi:LDH2 family malate/lactate/ureidoglycolate dehydrogenase